MKIFLIAGEPSGDLLGARLMAELKRKDSSLEFCGIGGPRMIEQGLISQFPMSDLTLFGLAELLPKIPLILRRMRETVEAIKRIKPDIVVTIDAPDFCFRIAKRMVRSDIPFVHYVAPTVWAWRAGRAKKIQPLFRHLLTLFPFEPPYFEKVGLPATFIGHPLVEAGIDKASADRLRSKYGLPANQPVLVLLPGSRRSEIGTLLGDFGKVLALLKPRHPDLKVVLPTMPHLFESIKAGTQSWPYEPLIVTTDEDKYDAFKAGTAALAASGTVALELGLAGIPAIIAYRIHAVTAALYRRLIKAKFANIVNMMVDRMVVPEFLQENCTPEKIAPALDKLLSDPAVRAQQAETLGKVHDWLSPEGHATPSAKAADVIMALLEQRRQPVPNPQG